MAIRFIFLTILSLTLWGCGAAPQPSEDKSILVMGDSMFAWNRAGNHAVSDVLAQRLDTQIHDRSVIGARVRYALPVSGSLGLSIPDQFREGPWDWIVVNGGGNDLWLGCGCVACNGRLERLISENGRRGSIPKMVSDLRATGARVIYVGYLRSPGSFSPIEYCREVGDKMEDRLARLEALDAGVYLVSLADLVPSGDRSFHSVDMIHPSVKGSQAIADRVAAVIRAEEERLSN